MPIDLHIIRASEFVRVGPREHLDFEASRQALGLLAAACRKRGIDRAMLDLRDLPIPPKPLFSSTQLAALVGTFKEAGFTKQQRLAVLYRADPHEGVRKFAFISTLRGWTVRAFSDFEAALMWLSSETGKPTERTGQNIPIQAERKSTPPESKALNLRKEADPRAQNGQ